MTYTGETNRKGKPHGQGTATSADCTTFISALKGGKQHGQGSHTYHDGATYTGE